MKKKGIYGLLAEFETTETLLAAAEATRQAGYRRMDAFTPMPVEGLAEAVGFHHTRLPAIVLGGGLFGCAGGFFLQYYPNVISFPLNIAGKPHNSWPSFIPITFEMTILFAALCRRLRDARPQWPAHAISSGFQCSAICLGLTRPVFSLH